MGRKEQGEESRRSNDSRPGLGMLESEGSASGSEQEHASASQPRKHDRGWINGRARLREERYSNEEKEALIEAYLERAHRLEDHTISGKLRMKLWSEIRQAVCCLGRNRSMDSIKHRYQDCKREMKNKLAKEAEGAEPPKPYRYCRWEELLRERLMETAGSSVSGELDSGERAHPEQDSMEGMVVELKVEYPDDEGEVIQQSSSQSFLDIMKSEEYLFPIASPHHILLDGTEQSADGAHASESPPAGIQSAPSAAAPTACPTQTHPPASPTAGGQPGPSATAPASRPQQVPPQSSAPEQETLHRIMSNMVQMRDLNVGFRNDIVQGFQGLQEEVHLLRQEMRLHRRQRQRSMRTLAMQLQLLRGDITGALERLTTVIEAIFLHQRSSPTNALLSSSPNNQDSQQAEDAPAPSTSPHPPRRPHPFSREPSIHSKRPRKK